MLSRKRRASKGEAKEMAQTEERTVNGGKGAGTYDNIHVYTDDRLDIGRGQDEPVLYGRGLSLQFMMSRDEIHGLARPAPVVRVSCHGHHRGQLLAALHGRGSASEDDVSGRIPRTGRARVVWPRSSAWIMPRTPSGRGAWPRFVCSKCFSDRNLRTAFVRKAHPLSTSSTPPHLLNSIKPTYLAQTFKTST
ncbi:hypothetical protein F2Q68_00006043 [Brassica cretica]|uniref:Uncharacterized protein n=1 Tax=Brassica cretica TaxID=69181 RepID=A0A8S9JAG1_BRACR|nr:hypothetical protein F2Q68_00006043 [Brassica cretica]